MDVRIIYRTCSTCGHRFGQPYGPGRKRRFCSDVCKQAAHRLQGERYDAICTPAKRIVTAEQARRVTCYDPSPH